MWTQAQAIALCIEIEKICPTVGYHVALTGGTLYKEGERKDIDLLFYSIRQQEPSPFDLFIALSSIGIVTGKHYGFVTKATYNGKNIDIFIPEMPKHNEDY